jgi:hypothetical protein
VFVIFFFFAVYRENKISGLRELAEHIVEFRGL